MKEKFKYRKIPGSMTVFLSLVLLLIASMLFAMLESARVYGIRAQVHMDSELLIESAFAEYNIAMLDEYGLFFLDGAQGGTDLNIGQLEQELQELGEKNLQVDPLPVVGSGCNLYQMELNSCNIESYELATDHNGESFRTQVVQYMKQAIPEEIAKELYQQVTKTKSTQDSAGDTSQKMQKANEEIQTAEEEENQESSTEENEVTEVNSTVKTEKTIENPIAYVMDLKNSGILSLVVDDIQQISNKAIDQTTTIEERNSNTGNYELSSSTEDWYANILYNEYLKEHFKSYVDYKEEGALNYELEYILVGKGTDKENLTGVVERLLAIREAANYIFLLQDRTKCGEALTLATALVGFTGNALLVKVVQEGILGAWAFTESVQDVRSLLEGKKIPLIKSSREWTMDTTNIKNSFEENNTAKECENGLGYRDYIRIMLFLSNGEKQNYHCMDMIEQNLRQKEGQEHIRMDCFIQKMSVKFSYSAKPLFLSFVTVGNRSKNNYQFDTTRTYSYLLTM